MFIDRGQWHEQQVVNGWQSRHSSGDQNRRNGRFFSIETTFLTWQQCGRVGRDGRLSGYQSVDRWLLRSISFAFRLGKRGRLLIYFESDLLKWNFVRGVVGRHDSGVEASIRFEFGAQSNERRESNERTTRQTNRGDQLKTALHLITRLNYKATLI